MISKLLSSLFSAIPENNFKNKIRAGIHRARHKEYKTYYRNNHWELHYPGFVLKYKGVPSAAAVNYLFFKRYTEREFDIIIDAGGFMGTFGLLMAKKYPRAKVYIFEADPANYKMVMDNLAVNNLNNVTVELLGLWSKKDVLKISTGKMLGSSFLNVEEQDETIEIPVTSIDDYFAGVTNKNVFLKMNIEGAEIAALQGAEKFMAANKIDYNICSDHIVNGELSYIEVEKIFTAKNIPFITLRDSIHINTHASSFETNRLQQQD